MTEMKAFLVVGGDSLVGGSLLRALEKRGHDVYGSTRRRDSINERRVHLDFEDASGFVAPADVGYAYIVAAATNYDRCERDPLARKINVELIPQLIQFLLKQGIFVSFVSTNSVFGGERPWPNEDDPHAPGIAYARQKAEAEVAIKYLTNELGANDRLAIIRLTKILDCNTSPLPAWFSAWTRGEVIHPFSDLIFAPMSVQFVGEALATIGKKRVAGDLHLSGAENVSYVDFASALMTRLGIDERLVAPTTAVERGVHIPFKPTYSGLGMKRTTALTGIRPQTLLEVVDDLIKEYQQ